MSEMEQIEISCPVCKTKKATQVCRSLNPSLDPGTKELLFAGKMNLFSCEQCVYEAFVPIDFIYHDPVQKYCVQFYPPHSIENLDFINSFTTDGLPMWVDTLGAMGKEAPHIVFHMSELIRYVEFRDRLAAKHSELPEKNTTAQSVKVSAPFGSWKQS